MARPAKAVAANSSNLTALEVRERQNMENKTRGTGELKAPAYLTKAQKKQFKIIVEQLKNADILGCLDVYILAQTAITVDRLQYMEQQINDDPTLLENSAFMASKDKYTRDFFRCCNELCLSPQSRAKLGAAAAQKKKSDPLMDVIGDDDD